MECLEEDSVLGLGQVKEDLCLGRIRGGRLLQEDMLAGLERLAGPFKVQAIGQGVVNAINLGVVDDGIVGRVGVGDIVCLCVRLQEQ